MKEFFKVTDLETILAWTSIFQKIATEEIPLAEATDRILSADIVSDLNLPDFPRSIVDGFAVKAASTFGASEANPAYLQVSHSVFMGEAPVFSLRTGEAAKIPTGGMLPKGADSVVMLEHTDAIDDTTMEVYRSVAPGQNMIEIGEDIRESDTILSQGQKLRPQEVGLLAAMGETVVPVYKKPIVSIISTGDEIVPIDEIPASGKIRDVNSYTLWGQVMKAGARAVPLGIVKDDFNALAEKCRQGIDQSDMVIVSGGSSVGMRDFTLEILDDIPEAEIMAHGISISPGKPTILARIGRKPFWGLPGHVVSAMVVFHVVVRPFLEYIAGRKLEYKRNHVCYARLQRNLASKQGRVDFIRVRLDDVHGELWAEPILGKSGLIHTMVKADGLVKIGKNTEGLEKGAVVKVDLLV